MPASFVLSVSQRTARAMALVVVLALLASLLPSLASAAGTGPSLRVSAPASVKAGRPIRIQLAVSGVRDLAGYEAVLTWAPTAAHLGGLELRRGDLGARGRGTAALGPAELPNGVAFGQYTCDVASCTSRSGRRQTSGVSGTVQLARVTLVPDKTGRVQVRLSSLRFVDSAGRPIAVDAPASFTVRVGSSQTFHAAAAARWALRSPGAALRTELTGDSITDHSDATEVAAVWGSSRTSAQVCSTRTARVGDVNGDGCVDVSDAQAVAADYSAQGARRRTVAPNGITGVLPPGVDVTITVNSTSDAADANPGDGDCVTSGGVCTLRAAITEANGHVGPETIAFAISGSGARVIQLASSLPTISNDGQTTIDGYTQPGAQANTSALVSNAVIRVEVRSSNEEVGWPALRMTSPNNVVRGLSFHHNWRSIEIIGPSAHNNAIVGNFIGTNAAGTYATTSWNHANGGIYLNGGPYETRIGRPALVDRNVISGNAASGIYHVGEGTRLTSVQNNLIGLNPSGTGRLANVLEGVDYNTGAVDNTVGGTGERERNVISGNSQNGVEFSHGVTVVGNKVIGNLIGTDATGTRAYTYTRNGNRGIMVEDGVQNTLLAHNVIGNGRYDGIYITGFVGGQGITRGTIVRDNLIGISLDGTPIPPYDGCCGIRIAVDTNTSQIGPNNVIAFNPIGIAIYSGQNDKHTITRNSIYGNTGLGIDLQNVGSVNVNDFGDGDSGANEQLNLPALTSATPTRVRGSACDGCRVEVFLATEGGNAFGEGRTFLGADTVDGNGRFNIDISENGVAVDDFVTATATDAAGNTSEFALNMRVRSSANLAGVTVAADDYSTARTDTWGQADTGGYWSFIGTTNLFDVVGDAGLISLAAGATRQASLLSVSQRDVELSARVRTDKNVNGGSQVLWLVARQSEARDEYRLRVRIDAQGRYWLNAARRVGGTETYLGADVEVPGVTHDPGTWLRVKGEVTGVNPVQLRVKAWTGADEPGWQYVATDFSASALTRAGAVGVAAYLPTAANNAPVTAGFSNFSAVGVDVPEPPPVAGFEWSQVPETLTIDFTNTSTGDIDSYAWDFGDGSNGTKANPSHTYAEPGVYTVQLTATGQGGPDVRTREVTVDAPAPPGPTTFAEDHFAVDRASGWGTAEIGGAWTHPSFIGQFSVANGTGNSTVPTPGATRIARLMTVQQRDVDVRVRVTSDKMAIGGNQFAFVAARRQDDGAEYAAKLRFGTNAGVYLTITRFDGPETQLANPIQLAGVTYAPGSVIRVRFQAEGSGPTTLRAKAWLEGSGEPADWQVVVTDDLAKLGVAGGVSVRSYLGGAATNAPVVFSYDDLVVTELQP